MMQASSFTGEPIQRGQGLIPSSIKELSTSLISCRMTFPVETETACRIVFFNCIKFPVQLSFFRILKAAGERTCSNEFEFKIAMANFSKSERWDKLGAVSLRPPIALANRFENLNSLLSTQFKGAEKSQPLIDDGLSKFNSSSS